MWGKQESSKQKAQEPTLRFPKGPLSLVLALQSWGVVATGGLLVC